MLQQEQQTREKFNTLKKYYDETWDKKAHTLHVGFFGFGAKNLTRAFADATRVLIERLDAISPIDNKSKIFDVGCGAGRTLMALCAKYQCSGVGVDLSDEQIKDAKMNLLATNKVRREKGLSILKVRFVQGSGSELGKIFPKGGAFSHVISQDALLLVVDKKSLFENIFRLLKSNGALAIADFLSEKPQKNFTKEEQKLIYKMVNWNEELSFNAYSNFLKSVGFQIVQAEERGQDMIKTYSLLAKELQPLAHSKDTVYSDLAKRYENIVSAVKKREMGWGLFFAVKPKV